MFVVPTESMNEHSNDEVASTSVASKSSPATNGNIPHAGERKEITLLLFPKKKQLGFQLQEDRKEGDTPVISTVDAGKHAVVKDCFTEKLAFCFNHTFIV